MLRTTTLLLFTAAALASCTHDAPEHPDAFARDEGASAPWLALEQPNAPTMDAGVDAAIGIPCAVELILQVHCRCCHDSSPLAPPPGLSSVADFRGQSLIEPERVLSDVALERVTATGNRRMPPLPAASLTPEELAVLSGWLRDGSPAFESCPQLEGTDPVVEPEPEADLHDEVTP